MKTICFPSFYNNGFVATHVQGHHVPKCRSCYKAIKAITRRVHCFHGHADCRRYFIPL